jgi:hypothetical protein
LEWRRGIGDIEVYSSTLAKFSSSPYFKKNQLHAWQHHKAGGIKISIRLEIRRFQLANSNPIRRLHFWTNHLWERKGMHTDCYLTCRLKYYKQQLVLTTTKGPHSRRLPKSYVQSYKDIWLQIHVGFTQCIHIMISLSRRTILVSCLLWACFLLRTIHYNTIFGPLERTNLPKLTYFTMQHTQAQLLLRVDMGNCRPI